MDNQARVLLVDDEKQFSAMTKEYLEAKGFVVQLEHSGDGGLDAYRNGVFDLCVLDVKMPIKDGFTLAEEIREINEDVPIIFLTGEQKKEQKIRGLRLGADDYVTKPFSMEEFFLRIQNILRRVRTKEIKASTDNVIYFGAYRLDPKTRELNHENQAYKLTAIEAKLLKLLAEHEGTVLEREVALKRIWGDEDFLKGRSLNVYVSKLRQYLALDSNIEIMNVHGVGYKMIVR